ncbi:MAG: type I pullulanase [Finegoldia magna]|uniref:type I pullulanase n=1 Tax=Finegoldia magna TaxID=1260 RepID=UPI0001DE4988|nr:type I pullulanase [Finegoldia magna]EFK93972.1 pullulanase, type I [Finegoldia magna ACS-171-V-Col3]MDU5272088.1 type I pullulanase [Finegoldia magna]
MYELGFNYNKEYTFFKIYAPKINRVKLLLYENYNDVRYNSIDMKKSDGYFEVKVEGDLDGIYYKYQLDEKFEIVDPFCKASSINSLKSCVVDLNSTNPDGFIHEEYEIANKNEAIIYELSIKDYSSDISSKIRDDYRGKFLGLIEESDVSGINHLKDLGITHVHLMPVFDFLGVDERNSERFSENNYNWGYNPENYNCIEGSYSTEPENPKNRIIEFKKMIKTLHANHIGVIMDVVYNHTFRNKDHPFNLIYPQFYRRNKDGDFTNGSGVGNELNTEDEFVRRFIIDSLLYFQKEFHIDGFRFDLMALIDSETTDKIVSELRKNDENVIIYGEPWMADESPLQKNKRTIFGSQKGKDYAFFNPFFRNAIKGDNDDNSTGFVQENVDKIGLETGICGSIYYDEKRHGFCENPNETINYFNSHDNLILQDKLIKTNADIETSTKLCFDLIILSQGIPFFHCGNEFLRSKSMYKNTYNLSLSVNAVDWKLKYDNDEIYQYVKSLIKFRKMHPEFNLKDANEIRNKIKFYNVNDCCICFSVKNNEGFLLVFINSGEGFTFDLNEYFEDFNKCTKIFDEKIIEMETNENVILIDRRKSGVYSISMEK